MSSEKSGGYLFYKSKNIEIVNVPENMADPSFVDHFNYHTNTVVQGSSVTSAYKLDYKSRDFIRLKLLVLQKLRVHQL